MLKTVGRIRLVSELASDPWTTTRAATGDGGAPLIVRLGRIPARFGPGEKDKFAEEAAQSRELGGPHLVPVLEHGVSFSIPWIAHPDMRGGPLATLLGEHPEPLAPDLVARIGADVASALEQAHACEPPLLHRGISLDTLWLDPEGPRVCVFGYALTPVCMQAARGIPPILVASRRFASPESVAGDTLGPGADVYSLAATLVALATGESPDAAALAGDPSALADVPAELRSLLARALVLEPAQRSTAAELAVDLRHVAGDEAVTRAALAAHFGLDPSAPPERERDHDGAPSVGLPLESVTKEQLLPEARASYAPYQSAASYTGPLFVAERLDPALDDVDAFDDEDALDFDSLLGEHTDFDASDRGDTMETVLPEASSASGDFDQMPTFVEANRRDAVTDVAFGGSGEVPLEPTLELPLPEPRPSLHERATDPPALSASSFDFDPPPNPLQRLAKVEVQGWPLPWLIGLGLGAVVMVAVVAVVTALLAS